MPEKPTRRDRRTIHTSPWVNLHLDQVEFPDGRIIDPFHMLDFDHESVAALVTNAEGHLLLVESYRYATDSLSWEIPGGNMDPSDASILAAARREVREETGFDTTDHTLLYSFYPLIGMANKTFHIVHCRALNEVGDFDRNEVRSRRWMSPTAVDDLVRTRTITDGYTLTALLLYRTGFDQHPNNAGV